MERDATEFLFAFLGKQRDLPAPAHLSVIIGGKQANIEIISILRLLPGKRVVVRGIFNNRAVVIKLFVKSFSSAQHIQRERTGYERARAAHVTCPELIDYCVSDCKRVEGLVYEFISDANELVQNWRQFDKQQKRHWLQTLIVAMLKLHRVGAAQKDIHLGNFLIKKEQLYLLDLGSIEIRSAPLSQQQCLNNLGQLIAQLDVSEQALFDAPVEYYFAQQGWQNTAFLKDKLRCAISKAWRYRLRDYIGKAQRDCSLTCYEKNMGRVFAYRRQWQGADLQLFLRDPDQWMAGGELLKAGNTATVVKATLNGKPVVIKRYNIKNALHAVSRSVRPTRAEHSWRFAHLLEIAGVDSLKPIAFLERRCGPLRSKAYFVCEWIDAPDLLSVANQRALDANELNALQALLSQMATCQLTHGDFKANNLLLLQDHIALIDLDAMQRHHNPDKFWRSFARDLARLQRNWPIDSMVFTQVESVIASLVAQRQSLIYL